MKNWNINEETTLERNKHDQEDKAHEYDEQPWYDEDDGDDASGFFSHLFSEKFWSAPFKASKFTEPAPFMMDSAYLAMTIMLVGISVMVFMGAFSQMAGGTAIVFAKFFPAAKSHYYSFFNSIDKAFTGPIKVFAGIGFFPVVTMFSFTLINSMEKFLDDIWGTVRDESTSKKLFKYWLILSIVPIPVFFMLGSTFWFKLAAGKWFLKWLVFPVVRMIGFSLSFAFIYKVLSKGVFNWKSALSAGAWNGVILEFVNQVFISVIISQFGAKNPASAVMGIVFFSGMWSFAAGCVFLFAGRVGYVSQFEDVFTDEQWDFVNKSDQRSMRETALICMLEMTKRFYEKEYGLAYTVGLDSNELSLLAHISPGRAKEVINHLHYVNLIDILHDDEREVAMLKVSPEVLTLDEFMARVEERVGGATPDFVNYPSNRWFWSQYEKTLEGTFGALSLKKLYEMENAENVELSPAKPVEEAKQEPVPELPPVDDKMKAS